MADLARVLQMFDKVKKGSTPDDFFACCPLHHDKTPSLHITQGADGTIMFHCFSCEADLEALQEARPELTMDMISNGVDQWPRPRHEPSPPPEPQPDPYGVSLSRLADYCQLPVEALTRHGLVEEGSSVMVPYLDTEMVTTSRKFRVAINGKGKYRYEKGSKITPYGLWRRRSRTMVFVEGESDCWTLWHHKVPAIGIPGASMTERIRPRDVAGVEIGYVIQETGEAGEGFARRCAKRLEELGVATVRIVDMGEDDDPTSLYKADQAGFLDRMRDLFRRSKTLAQVEAEGLFKPASSVSSTQVSWLHERYMPVGHLTLLAGLPGTGKTTVAASYAASVSTGQPMPRDTRASDPGQVLFLSREDGEGQIRGRLEAAGCYLDNVQILREESGLMLDGRGVDRLRTACQVLKPRLVVIDPVVDYLGGELDMNHAQDVRSVLRPLMGIASEMELGILMLAHNSKKMMVGSAQDSVAGSRDWTASSRSVLTLYPDPAKSEGMVLAQVKNNLSKPGDPIRFCLVDEHVIGGHYARVQWGEASPLDAEDIQSMMATPQMRQALADARDYLLDCLAAGSQPIKDVLKGARARGVQFASIRLAEKVLSVERNGDMMSIRRDYDDPPAPAGPTQETIDDVPI